MATPYNRQESFGKKTAPKTAKIEKEGIVVGRGATQTVVDPDEVYKLAKLWCTYEEIADWVGCNSETLKYNFMDIIVKGRGETKQALRRAQLKNALGGNTTMQIWLGKQILKQQESPLTDDETKRLNDILPTIVRIMSNNEKNEGTEE